MRSILLALVLMFSFSCSNDNLKEIAINTITGVASPSIAIAFSCSNQAAVSQGIKEELTRWFDTNKVTSNIKSKGINSSLCEAAITAILPSIISVANGQLPAEWACTSEFASDSVVNLAKVACQAIQ